MDYAETEKMKSVLMLPMKNESYSFGQCGEVSVSKNQIHLVSPEHFGPRVTRASGFTDRLEMGWEE